MTLAGTLWFPASLPLATVLMHPGSGPSDRDNDVFFPPIRGHLLARNVAVCSFDKRGVGGSSGRWTDAGIVDQADDALACLRAARAELDRPIGLFGHSQGGWVVVEAASRSADVAFAMTSSGPGVTPAEQERYAATAQLERSGASADQMAAGMRHFDLLAQLARDRAPFEEARQRASDAETAGELDSPFVPNDEDVWNFHLHGSRLRPEARPRENHRPGHGAVRKRRSDCSRRRARGGLSCRRAGRAAADRGLSSSFVFSAVGRNQADSC